MKAKSRILAALMALIMIIGLLPVSAFAENNAQATNVDYISVNESPENNTDAAVENEAGDTEKKTEEAEPPSNPDEMPGSIEEKEQKEAERRRKTLNIVKKNKVKYKKTSQYQHHDKDIDRKEA